MSSNGRTPMGLGLLGRSSMKVLGVAVLGAGLLLGGCNKGVKEQNEQLTQENAALREKTAAAESEKAAMQSQMDSLRAENSKLATQQPPMQPMGMNGQDSGGNGKRTSKGGGGNDIVIEVAGDVLFGPGSATLKPDAKKELDQVASRIKSQGSGHNIRIEGHTDSDPIKKSKWKSNEALSKARADAVRDYMVAKGISSSRISTVGMGSSQPKSTKKDSRRVDIVIVDN